MAGVCGKVVILCLTCVFIGASAVTPQDDDGGVVVDPRPAVCADNQIDSTGIVGNPVPIGGLSKTFSGHQCFGAPRGC